MPPRRSSSNAASGGGRKRYAAAVEKGENAWKREWNSFISGVDMKRVRDGTTSVSLRAKADLAHGADRDSDDEDSGRRRRMRRSDHGDDSAASGAPSFPAAPVAFSYLFASPAEKRAERNEKRKRELDAKKRKARENTVSKHQQALEEAQKRGLKLEGMSRKQVRDFLHLTRSREQMEAQQHARELKLHDLMDEKIAWYQQGPHPIDLIAERLVARKAAKKGKRLGLTKYNYLLPHPSWMAARTRRRREGVLVGLGKRFTFDEETGQALDPLHGNVPVDLTKVSLLLHGGGSESSRYSPGPAAANVTLGEAARGPAERETGAGVDAVDDDDDDDDAHVRILDVDDVDDAADWNAAGGEGRASASPSEANSASDAEDEETAHATRKRRLTKEARAPASAPSASDAATFTDPRALDRLLIDPTRALTTFSRAVVKNREAALVIQRANLTTNFLSSSLVKGPSIGHEEDDKGGEEDHAQDTSFGFGARTPQAPTRSPAVKRAPKPPPRSSFDPTGADDEA